VAKLIKYRAFKKWVKSKINRSLYLCSFISIAVIDLSIWTEKIEVWGSCYDFDIWTLGTVENIVLSEIFEKSLTVKRLKFSKKIFIEILNKKCFI
jgi:hypothetical protein